MIPRVSYDTAQITGRDGYYPSRVTVSVGAGTVWENPTRGIPVRNLSGCLVDTVVWVLGYQDKKIERGVGHFTPKLLILSAPNHYRPLVETASSGHEGSTWAKVGGVVVMLAGHTGKPCRGLQN